MTARLARRLRALILVVSGMASGTLAASGLQVSPVSLTLTPAQAADGLWLSDTGTDPLQAQVRVYRWTQRDGQDQLEPSRDLVISPPMLQIDAGSRQLIRVIRTGAPPSGAGAAEASYRVIIDELPAAAGKRGVKFVMRYSVPVFVEPVGADTAPALHWSLGKADGHAFLEVTNTGTRHAQLAQVSVVDRSGRRTDLAPGLLGYVLPGATMHWTLKAPAEAFNEGGTLDGMVNGQKVQENLSLATRSR
jgi:fimbrial chaperone protein